MNRAIICGTGILAVALSAIAQPPPPSAPTPPPARPMRVYAYTPGGSYLGVGVREIDSARVKELNLKQELGVELTQLEPGGPAEKAGMKVGDVIVEFNGQKIDGTEQFVRMVRETPPGRQVKLGVLRKGASQTLTATIGQKKELEPRARVAPRIEMPEMTMPMPMPDIPMANMTWRTGMLGVEVEGLGPQLAEYFGVKEGVLVRSVVKDSPAQKAGLKAGDVILKVDENKITNPRELTSSLRMVKGKRRTYSVRLMREHRETSLDVTIDEDHSEWVPNARTITSPQEE
jgi:serine protease Do